jgi:hypothetical protein
MALLQGEEGEPAPTPITPPEELRLFFEPFHILQLTFSTAATLYTGSPMTMGQGVPERSYLNYRCQGTTEKRVHNIQNMEKV